jgi:hypothetical protein
VIDCLFGREKDARCHDASGQLQIGAKYAVLATLTDQFDRARGKANVEDILTNLATKARRLIQLKPGEIPTD